MSASMRIEVAPSSLTLSYDSDGLLKVNIVAGRTPTFVDTSIYLSPNSAASILHFLWEHTPEDMRPRGQ